MTEQPNVQTQTKRDGHLTVYLAWPILAGLALATVLAVSIGGITLLASGLDWSKAGMAFGIAFFLILGIATLAVFWYAAHEFAGPRSTERVAEIRQTVYVDELEPPEPEVRFIPTRGRRPALNEPAPALPSGQNRAGIREAMQHLVNRLTADATVTEVATEAETLEVDAPAWVREFYQTLVTVWPTQSLSRRTFEGLWPGGEGKRLWSKYVNGTGSRHSQRGLWDVWGIISQTGPRNTWEWCHDLQTIFSLDRDLHTYATAMAELVHSPTPLGRAGQPVEKLGQTDPDHSTRPIDQTKGAAT